MTAVGYTQGSGALYFEYVQSTPSSNWTVTHNFGVHPQVSVLDSSGNLVIVGVSHTSVNALNIVFPAPFSGRAVLTA